MADATKMIDGKKITATKWGFFALLERKRRILELVGVSVEEIAKLLNPTEGEDNGETITSLLNVVVKIVNGLDEQSLRWFAETILENVSVNGELLTNESADIFLAGNISLFYKIVLHVLEVNYGDFLAMIGLQTNSKS